MNSLKMKHVIKVLTGNEHGGAAMSSELLLDGIMSQNINFLELKIIMLCNGEFAQKIKKKYPLHTEILNSSAPPIILHPKIWIRVLNWIHLFIWFIVSTIRLSSKLYSKEKDIIHTTNNYALIICCFYRMFHRTKLIAHWRCIGGERNRLFKKIVDMTDEFICISESVKESLPLEWQFRSQIIYNGIEVRKLRKAGESKRGLLRSYLNINVDMPLFGTIGSYTDIKCHDLLIESCYLIHQKHPHLLFKCALIGSTPNKASETYLQKLKEKVLNYGLSDLVIFVPDNAVSIPSMIIIDYDFFVGSTWYEGRGEGFGLIYIEAMTQSLPVIAIKVGAAKELITPETGLLIDDNSVIKHAENIIKMIDENYRKRFNSEVIYHHALTYDISNTINGVLKIYE